MELLVAIKEAERLASDDNQAQDRIDLMDQYLGEKYGNEVEGRSQVVDRTIQNTVEWIKPQLIKTFCGSDIVVKFEPTGKEDTEAAEQETEYTNFIITQRNNWMTTFYEACTDALILRNGYIKAWWDESEDLAKESYDDLTDDEFAMLMQDPDIEVVEHEEEVDEEQAQQRNEAIMQLQTAAQSDPNAMRQLQRVLMTPDPKKHSVTLQRRNETGQVRIKAIDPNQVLVSHNADSICLQDAPFVEHWEWKTISQLRLEGFSVPDDIGDDSDSRHEWETEQARGASDSRWWQDEEEQADPSMRRVKAREVWIRFDANGDGKAELIHAIVVGSTILEQDECDVIPLTSLAPQIMPHRHVGMSIADAVKDLQEIKTILLRNLLDNLYLSVNGRHAIDASRVNIDDLLTSRPGGIVRVQGDPGSAIVPLLHQSNYAPIMQGIQYIDDSAESRTGVTKYTQGLDANHLNKTASGIQQISNMAQERVMLIARIMAETGVKEIFWLVHSLIRKHQKKPDVIRLRNEWVTVDPRSWVRRYDMSISVGLGTSSKDQQLAHLANIYQMQMGALQIGLPIITPMNIYETMRQIAVNAGFKQPEQFVTDPQIIPPKHPQPDPKLMIEQAKLEADMQKFEAEQIADQNKFKAQTIVDQRKAEQEAALAQQMAERQLANEQLRSQNDLIIEREKLAMQAELERFKAQLKAETDIKIAAMNAEIQARQQAQEAADRQNDQAMQMHMHREKLDAMSRPKKVVRDQSGRVSGVE